MPHSENETYIDDRIYVLELRRSGAKNGWLLVTRRNTRGYPPTRADEFEDYETAKSYMEKIEPEVPRVSLDGRQPDPILSLEEHRAWVEAIGGRQNYDEGSGVGEPFFPGEVECRTASPEDLEPL